VTAIKFHIQFNLKPEERIPDLLIKHSICCEGIPMQYGETQISGDLIEEAWISKE